MEKLKMVNDKTEKEILSPYGEKNQDFVIPDEDSTPEEVEKFMKEHAVEFYASILQDGKNGYLGEISRFEPEPTADNNYLCNDKGTKISGIFYDDTAPKGINAFHFEFGGKNFTNIAYWPVTEDFTYEVK